MSRKPRVHYHGALYHVLTRGNNKNRIFLNDKDKDIYLKKMRKYLDRYGGKALAYALLDNHCHFLIQVTDIPLSKIMQLVQQTYTSFYNKKYNRSGHVFEQRYKAILVNKDDYLLTLIKYIHFNIVKAGVSGLDYKYSSHSEYVKGKSIICNINEVLGLLADNKRSAISRYCRLMSIDEDLKHLVDQYYSLNTQSVDEDRLEHIHTSMLINEIIKQFEEKYLIKIDLLKGRHYRRKYIDIRDEFIVEVVKNRVMSQIELATFLGVSPQLVYKIWSEND